MSRRVTTKSDITDRDLAVHALKLAGIDHQVQGDLIHFKSGGLAHSVLNLNTGSISGDTDYGHTEESLGMLRAFYQEAQFRQECAKQGTVIDSREIAKNGDIILMWHTA